MEKYRIISRRSFVFVSERVNKSVGGNESDDSFGILTWKELYFAFSKCQTLFLCSKYNTSSIIYRIHRIHRRLHRKTLLKGR